MYKISISFDYNVEESLKNKNKYYISQEGCPTDARLNYFQ